MNRPLQEIYDQIPDVPCRGLCHTQCTAIPMAAGERARIAALGYRIPTVMTALASDVVQCPALSALGTCRAHDNRPLICRLYGAAEGLECPHGCRPGRYLTRAEADGLIAGTERAAGPFS